MQTPWTSKGSHLAVILPCPLIHFCNYTQGGEENKNSHEVSMKDRCRILTVILNPVNCVGKDVRKSDPRENKQKNSGASLCYCNTFPFQHVCFLCIDTFTKAKKKKQEVFWYILVNVCFSITVKQLVTSFKIKASMYTSWMSECSLCLCPSSLQKSVSARMEVFASMRMVPVNVQTASLDSTVSLVCPYKNCKQCSSKLWLSVLTWQYSTKVFLLIRHTYLVRHANVELFCLFWNDG